MILILLFVLFGIMSPAIAKLTPWMMETLSDSMAENGLIVTNIQVDALTSWTQFFKNIPIALIAFVLIFSDIFTKEYKSGTLLLVLTKGLSRYKVVLAKAMLLLSLWTVGYGICFAITYGLHALLFFFHRCCKTMQVLLCALAGQCCLLVYSMRCCKYPDYKQGAALSMCVKAMKTEWIYYSICGNKTRTMIREDTKLRNFPLYCPKCKKKTIISVQDMKVTLAEHK